METIKNLNQEDQEEAEINVKSLEITDGAEKNKIRNVILIGRTGNGKSTLANVINDSSNSMKFKESELGVSETKDLQAEIIEVDGINYRIIDTIGIGDTRLGPREVLFKIAKAARLVEKEGVSQILFVSKGRFTKEEIDAYNLLRTVIFDHSVVKYTTIIRSGFSNFRRPDKCSEDTNKLLNENEEMADVISSCKKILYVNNPSIDTGDQDEEKINKKARSDSRNIILLHLGICNTIYNPLNLNELNKRIGNVMTEAERQEKIISEFTRRLQEEKDLSNEDRQKFQKKIDEAEKEKELLKKEVENKLQSRIYELEAKVEYLENNQSSCVIS